MSKSVNKLKVLSNILKYHCAYDMDFYPSVGRAQLIIAELAKVKIVRNKLTNEICWPTTGDVMDAFDKILKIAGEGEVAK